MESIWNDNFSLSDNGYDDDDDRYSANKPNVAIDPLDSLVPSTSLIDTDPGESLLESGEPTLFSLRWSEFASGLDSAEIVDATWAAFVPDGCDQLPLTVVENMLREFFMAVPNVDRIRAQVPRNALRGLVDKHVQMKMEAMFGPPHERLLNVLTREQFNASFSDLFAGAAKLGARSVGENPFQDTTMSGFSR